MLRLDTSSLAVRDPWLRALVVVLTIIAALYLGQMVWQLVAQIADLIVLFLVAWIISFVLQPSVTALTRIPWLPRTAAVLAVYLALLVVLAAATIVLVPELARQSTQAADVLPEVTERIGGWGSGLTSMLAARGLVVGDYNQQLLESVRSIGPALVGNALVLATFAASAVVQVILTIALSLYFMLDGQRIGNYLLQAVPPRYRDDFIYFVSRVYQAFGGFLRGQIIQGLVYGVGVAAIMLFTGLPFVALASVVAGVAMFIPFIGPPLGLIPPLVVALVTTDLGGAALVVGSTVMLNVLVINVVAPKVMSQQIGLHPVLILAAFLIGARIAGPWGAVFGVPVAAVIVAMLSFYRLTVAERQERVLEVRGPAEASETPAEEEASPVRVS